MKLAMVGTGYVGLVAGVCFAEMGNDVVCVDIDHAKVERLKQGRMPIYEPALDHYFQRNLTEGRLTFTTDLAVAVRPSAFIFLALPTPPDEDGSADLSHILRVADQLGPLCTSYKVVVTKSTVPVGTADLIRDALEQTGRQAGVDFDVVSNPEFLREGAAVVDFMTPERVVVGTSSPRAADLMKRLYAPFVRQGNPILVMDERSAEMTKYAANAFLATKISFINEIANLCARAGANVDCVRRGIGTDSRIGNKFLYPGLGFGGSCFPKDVRALHKTAEQYAYDFQLLSAVLEVNARQHLYLTNRIQERFGGLVRGKRMAVWGLAFKAHTDDVRESPAHRVIEELLARGAHIVAFDPEAMDTTRAVFGNAITYAGNLYEALHEADALVICTEWPSFRRPDWSRMRRLLNQPLIFDGRNLYEPACMTDKGFEYHSVGRPSALPTRADSSHAPRRTPLDVAA